MIEWSLARQIARFAAGAGDALPLHADLPAFVAEAEPHLRRYTGLEPATPIPAPEALTRPDWAEINVDSMAALLGPVADRLGDRFDGAGPLAGPLRLAAGGIVAAEVGLVLGYMSQRVLGQYELSLVQPVADTHSRSDAPPRLLFVAPNIAGAIRNLGIDRDSFVGWIVLHELTHVFQFSGVPWLRDHLGSLLRDYLATVEVRVERPGKGGLPALPDVPKLVESFREGGLIALVQSPEQREIMDRLQSVMCVIEGYSEHVMDAVGEDVLPQYAGLREAMNRRRRNRSAPERMLQRLLGLDLKMRQYELGKQFCDAVAERHGVALLNRVWDGPEALPTAAELDDPDAWAARIGGGSAAAA
jgi:coenzyme F420 biosynthesis associated uncharacterized protein